MPKVRGSNPRRCTTGSSRLVGRVLAKYENGVRFPGPGPASRARAAELPPFKRRGGGSSPLGRTTHSERLWSMGRVLSDKEVAQRRAIPRGPCQIGCTCRKHLARWPGTGRIGNRFAVGNRSKRGQTYQHPIGCRCRWHHGLAGPENPAWRGGPGYSWNGRGWKAVRRIVWVRDLACKICGLPPRKRHLDVHHIIARRDGGTNDPANLVGVHAGRCHKLAEAGKIKFA